MNISFQDLPRHSRAPGFGGVQRSQGEELPPRPPLDHGRGQRLPGMYTRKTDHQICQDEKNSTQLSSLSFAQPSSALLYL